MLGPIKRLIGWLSPSRTAAPAQAEPEPKPADPEPPKGTDLVRVQDEGVFKEIVDVYVAPPPGGSVQLPSDKLLSQRVILKNGIEISAVPKTKIVTIKFGDGPCAKPAQTIGGAILNTSEQGVSIQAPQMEQGIAVDGTITVVDKTRGAGVGDQVAGSGLRPSYVGYHHDVYTISPQREVSGTQYISSQTRSPYVSEHRMSGFRSSLENVRYSSTPRPATGKWTAAGLEVMRPNGVEADAAKSTVIIKPFLSPDDISPAACATSPG